MNVLFLDIDGVLNRNGTRERHGNYIGVDRHLSDKLVRWINSRGVKVVLSSMWRLHPDSYSHLNEAGIEWIGITPDFAERSDIPIKLKADSKGILIPAKRGDEIQDFLDKNQEIKQYAILDDWDDMLPSQKPFFVRTSDAHGLQDSHLAQLDKIFGFDSNTGG